MKDAGRPSGYAVAQLGARMHYAVPRVLERAGRLQGLYTDLAGVAEAGALARSPLPRAILSAMRRAAGRMPDGIPPSRVTSFPAFGLSYALRRRLARTPAGRTAVYLKAGSDFCRLVARALDWERVRGIYAFNSAALELLEEARGRGVHAVLEQTIAPRSVEEMLLAEERERHPSWEPGCTGGEQVSRFCEREAAEWRAADAIVCGSAFVRDGIREAGGPWERCKVVPYAYEPAERPGPRAGRPGPLRVLTVGAFSLRKGTPYVIEAARRMAGGARFRIVGPVSAPAAVVRDAARHVEVAGPVPRSAVPAHYAWADVFLLPSICEGSATATYEALAWGLPVVCTANTGSVVRDGVDGFIVGRGDPEAISGRLDVLARDPDLLGRMSAAAFETMRNFTMARYADRLFESVFAAPGRPGAGESRQ